MTASTVKSTNLTNIVTNPISVINNVEGVKKVHIDKIAVATTSIDEINDVILMGLIPSNAVITSIKIFNDDLDSNGSPALAANVGLYYTGIGAGQIAAGKAMGDAVDVDCIGSAITTLQAANTTGVEIRFEAADITSITSEAWALGELSADCGGFFAIGFKVTTVAGTAAAGDIVMVIEYI